MKKVIMLIIMCITLYVIIGNVIAKNDIIPEEAIRIRVIANSNSDYDQNIKNKVKEQIENDMYNLLKNSKTIEEVRNKVNNNVEKEKENISTVLKKENYQLPFEINFGYNYFPKKEFKGITYKEGYYESLVVTLGEGLGDNWWCVLFPPLCMIEAEDSTDVEYTSMVKELISKYF